MSSTRLDTAAPGIDVPAVTAWLSEHVGGLAPPLAFTRIGEGQSNLTYRVDDDAGRSVVLRRPPLGELLASAHDVAREHRILTALGPTSVPVPGTLALCEDDAVSGAPFFVMARVDGLAPTHRDAVEQLTTDTRAAAGRAAVSTLVALHGVDVDAIGLGDFRRPESLISRQVRRWTRQWHGSKTRDLPLIDKLAEELGARMPEERETVLLHGDYHLHNFLLGHDGSVRALLDWELTTVGDPLADVGLMVAYWNELGSVAGPDGLFREPITTLPGFPSATELGAGYAEQSGRELDELSFWVAFSYWKIAIIVEGVYRRWLNDPANGSDAGTLGSAVDRLAACARRALDGEFDAAC
jgi:aminoglycoside phosphotransferase (APT) family kinase protein